MTQDSDSSSMGTGKFRPPLKSVRAHCLDCCCGNPNEVKLCPSGGCPLHPYRSGHRPKDIDGDLPTAIRSIRLKCVDCSAGNNRDVRECWNVDCNLYPYRMGKNPNRAGKGNPDSLMEWNRKQKMSHRNEDWEDDEEGCMELVTAGQVGG